MIKPLKEVADKDFKTLNRYQKGKIQPIRTGREWLDSVFGGLIPGDITTIAGASGGGKSFEEQRLKNFIMSPENNEKANDYVWLSYSLEMRYLSTIIRDVKELTGKSKRNILTQEFTDEEKKLVEDYYKSRTDGRFFIEEEVIEPNEFRRGLTEFLEAHKDKAAVFVSIDHIALVKGSEKKGAVDATVEIINELRKVYKNTYWIILTQLNREIEKRIQEKSILAKPVRGDIFQSDTMYHISDYLYVSHNPYALGIKDFLKVNVKQYDYLINHFSEIKDGKGSFATLGKIFYIVLKQREGGVVFKNIFIEDINEVDKTIYEEPKPQELVMETPQFHSEALSNAQSDFDDF
jgi:replicative DNA helicase